MTRTKTGKKYFFVLAALCVMLLGAFFLYKSRQTIVKKPSKIVPTHQIVEETNDLFSPIPPTASEEARVARYRLYQKVAKEADYLEIKDCKPNPIIIKVLDKPNLVIKNSGAQDRTIWIEWSQYRIPAKGQITLPLDFAFKQKRTENGTIQTRWWYACDLNQGVTTGIIWVGIGDDR